MRPLAVLNNVKKTMDTTVVTERKIVQVFQMILNHVIMTLMEPEPPWVTDVFAEAIIQTVHNTAETVQLTMDAHMMITEQVLVPAQ